MAKCYDQYCPMAHALDLVGERWSLLIVRELLEDDQLRYSDLHARLPGCGTNILAARLKTLEQGGVVRRRKLDPPAGSWVYELTEYGSGLREVLHVLAHWGARSLRPPARSGDLEPGWLHGALRIALPAASSPRRIEFRIGGEVAAVVDDSVVEGPVDDPEAVVTGDAPGFYCLMVDRDVDAVTIEGDAEAVVTGDTPSFYRLMVDRDIDAVTIEGDAEAVRAMLASLPAVPRAAVPA